MNKIITTFLLALISHVGFSQDSTSDRLEGQEDIPAIHMSKKDKDGNYKKKRVEVGFVTHNKTAYFGIYPSLAFGWNRFMDNGSVGVSKANADLTLDKGPEFSIYPLAGGVYLNKKHSLKIYTALGLDYNTYHFERDITLLKGKDELTYVMDDSKHFSKNLLRSTYVTMPLLFVIRPAKGSKFEINAGVEGGILVGAKTKQISSEDGKVKVNGTFNLNPVRYGLRFGLGYDNLNIYAKYYLSDVFAKGEGPEDFKTVAIGISFGLY